MPRVIVPAALAFRVPFPITLAIIGDHMRRILLPIFLFAGLVIFVAGVWAEDTPPNPAYQPIVINPPDDWIGVEIKVTDLVPVPRMPEAGPAADQCSQATPLQLSFSRTADGGGTVTNLFTQEATDPALSCMFGVPSNIQGYRTAWYQLAAGDSSIVTITTEGTEYDTVVGVFTGNCDALQSLACSDDFRSFQSSVTFSVLRKQTYYIMVADYHSGAGAATRLQLSAVMREGGARWSQQTNLPFGGVSRHALVSDGADMYVIGGQTNIRNVAELTNKLLRYNVVSNQWAELADMPGTGLSNTTAVRLGKKIYLPGGFNGDTSNYSNKHLVYDIATDFWQEVAPVPAALLPSGKMFAWSAGVAGPGETSYYLSGGTTSYHLDLSADEVVINNTYRYTPATNQWEAFQPMTTARYAHTSAWVSLANRGLCVAGGLTAGEDADGDPIIVLLSDGECYNPAAGGGWRPTGRMNFPRYNAGSAIGPDGRWYVFGGVDEAGGVPETEVYDPVTNSWQVLGGEFSLGGLPQNPAREWPRGAFWGENLFVFGGNTPSKELRVISSVDVMTAVSQPPRAANTLWLPITMAGGLPNLLETALPLGMNSETSGNFSVSTQFFNPYYFDWPLFGRAKVLLSNIPANSNFNISVYDAQKVLRGRGNTTLYGGQKEVSVTLAPGRYYVVVERIFPKDLADPAGVYRLLLTGG